MFDVFFYEAFTEEAETLKKYLPSGIKAGFSWETIQEKKDNKPGAPIISIRTQSRIPPEWENQLAAILTRSTGYDHLLRYQTQIRKPINLGYLPLYCNRAVAEQAMLLWMALLRKLPQQISQFTDFNRDGLTGRECENKVLLVVGVGNIGSQVVKIGQGLGMKVLGVDLVKKYDFVDYFSIEEAIPQADIIVCAMNLTKANLSYFNYQRLKQARRGVVFINIARGEFSPAVDLLKLLEEGHLAGLGMDVYNRESELAVMFRNQEKIADPEVKATRKLSQKPNVIFTPHNAFNTIEAVERKSFQSIEQLKYFLKNGKFLWPLPLENL
jgi:D-lactate dehydrogenase